MPLLIDWTADEHETLATVNIIHYTMNPIEGNRSLRIEGTTQASGSPAGSGAVYLLNPPHEKGHALGRIRCLMRLDGANISHAGIYCCASQAVGIAGSGSAYVIGVDETLTLGVRKITTGGLASGVLATIFTTSQTLSIGVPVAIEVTWYADLDLFGGTEFFLSYGEATDFSDLTEIAEGVDTMSPLLTAQAEGVYATCRGTSKAFGVMYDLTTVAMQSLA